MKARIASAFLVVLAASVAAADDTAPPKPGEPAKPAAPAKKERKTSPEADAALKKFASLLAFPSPKYKSFEMNSHCEVAMMGGEVGCRFTVKEGGAVGIDIQLPEAVREQYGEAQLAQFKNGAKSLVGGIFKPFIVTADAMAKQYDVSSKAEGGKTVVEMTKFEDGAAWDKLTLWIGADGLVEKQAGTPNVDPNDPTAAMSAGDTIETTFEYKKRGDLFTIEGAKVTQAIGESVVKIDYYEIPGQAALPKELTFTSPFIPEPLVISMTDFVLDGKAVAETARKKDEKPAEPAKPEGTKPAEPVKPAEPPKK
jgi:hypothetical protein